MLAGNPCNDIGPFGWVSHWRCNSPRRTSSGLLQKVRWTSWGLYSFCWCDQSFVPIDRLPYLGDLTITLLLGMMIVVASLRLSGFFAVANAWVGAHARRPLILLGAIVATSGVFSAFLVNDAICFVLTPLVLEMALALDASLCPTSWPWRWRRMWGQPRRSPVTRRTS